MNTTTQIPTTTAARVAELEAAPLADQLDDAIAATTAAIAEDRAAAIAVVFPPDIVRATADDLAVYTWHVSRYDRPGFGARMAALFARALVSAPELCPLLTSPEALADIESAAASLASPRVAQESYADAQRHAAAEARELYELAIATQLAACSGDLAAPARQILACEQLAARLNVVKARREEFARQQAEQAERDRRATADAADLAADQAAADVLMAERRLLAGLPESLTDGVWYNMQRPHCLLLATTKRRLLATTKLDGIRLELRGSGRGLYNPRELANALGNMNADELRAILQQLDAAEGRPS